MITRYFNIVRRWLWLLALATLIAGATTYWLSSREETLYQAKARLIVGPGIDSPNPDLNSLRTGAQLMQTYAELATMQPVLQAVADDLHLDASPKDLDDQISVKVNKEAQILSITVKNRDPGQTAAIANALADILVRLSPSNPNSAQAKLKEQIRDQAQKLETSVANSEALIARLEKEFQAATDIEKQRQLMDQLSQERTRLTETHRTLALLYNSLEEASVNQVQIVEFATLGKPVASQLRLEVMIGAIAGLIMGGVIALAFEYFDNSIGTAEELTQTTGLALLGEIARTKRLRRPGPEQLVIRAQPRAQAAENYRMLGTKLLAKHRATGARYRLLAGTDVEQLSTANDHALRSILLSGSLAGDDAGLVAANLAVILAQTDRRVILVDAYLHHPTIDQLFGIADPVGLSGTLSDESKEPEPTAINWAPGLSVLPAGPSPANPFELLASSRMADLIEALESQADIVLIAGSPLLSFADSLILASRVDGVAVVARSGQTNREVIQDAIESLQALETHIVGTILDHNRPARLSSHSWLRRSGRQNPQGGLRPATQAALPSGQSGPQQNASIPLKTAKS